MNFWKRSAKDKKDIITWRGHEVSRIEAFSDAVFALAVTLLIISMEVPKTYNELIESLKGFVPFAISFSIFFMIWYTQNMFFRRYGLHDVRTVTLNAFLLFMVLFFVYPLKFLWNVVIFQQGISTIQQGINLFYLYSGGIACIYILLTLMYLHAYRKREYLKLNPEEIFETRSHIYRNLVMLMIAVLSILGALSGILVLAWISYPFTGLFIYIFIKRREKAFHKLFRSGTATPPEPITQAATPNEPLTEEV